MTAAPTAAPTGAQQVVLVPGVLALLPEYAGQLDAVGPLRAACLNAVGWLRGPVTVLADPQGERVGRALVAAAGAVAGPGSSYVVVGNGSACRSEKAPGFLDHRSHAFDVDLDARLRSGRLDGIDLALGAELAASLVGITAMAGLLADSSLVEVDYDDDPFGVQYWVMRWARLS